MNVIVCVDDRMGMLFNHRRQSRDQVLNDYLLSLRNHAVLRMNSYSAPLFAGAPNVMIQEDFLNQAQQEDFCFVENTDLTPYEDRIRALIICRWNRSYPGDTCLTLDLKSYKLQYTDEFPGSSHEKITVEVYSK